MSTDSFQGKSLAPADEQVHVAQLPRLGTIVPREKTKSLRLTGF